MQIQALGSLFSSFAARQQGAVSTRGRISQLRPGTTQVTASSRGNPSGLALYSQLRNATVRLKQGRSNAQHAISMIDAADDTLARTVVTLADALVLAAQASSGGYTPGQQASMQSRLEGLLADLTAAPASVDFRGTNLLTATDYVAISLGEGSGAPSRLIRVDTQDVSAIGLGLGGVDIDPTSATLTGGSAHAVGNTTSPYMKGPSSGPGADLTFTFYGSQGDKVATINLKKNKSIDDIVALINTETEALIPGWSAAEAVQDAGNWVVKLTNYEAGEADAPDVSVSGTLKWKNNDLVVPADFDGVDGVAATSGALTLGASDTIEKIEAAIDTITAFRADLAASVVELEVASSSMLSASEHAADAEARITDPAIAAATAYVTSRNLLSQEARSVLFQANVTAAATMQLLGIEPVDDDSISFALNA